ncbi:DUF6230 family protein [Amycolatopsis alkalitolerans]|uniref:Cholesterol esterase n=1 Tax=Amycolatopsis alkalitolerans TaxID=2547244 RepID=A0A5C4LRZ5_9PSEU|nr:DUF6230 family protein [Amycolatopsis alkalitolerans]TNC18875.1 hypothetical protein FG385_33235 [Amycolatopsis alkalitolerans]
MSDEAAEGRVRWGRFTAAFVPATVLTGALFVLTAQGVLATSFSVAGTPFRATASSVAGDGFVNYGKTLPTQDGQQHYVAVNALRTAKIKDFCMAIKVGPITTLMKAGGGGGAPVQGTDVAFIVKDFNGDGVMHNVVMGQDAGSLSAVPGYQGAPGEFGMQANAIELSGPAMHAREMAAGTISLPGFGMSVTHGGSC